MLCSFESILFCETKRWTWNEGFADKQAKVGWSFILTCAIVGAEHVSVHWGAESADSERFSIRHEDGEPDEGSEDQVQADRRWQKIHHGQEFPGILKHPLQSLMNASFCLVLLIQLNSVYELWVSFYSGFIYLVVYEMKVSAWNDKNFRKRKAKINLTEKLLFSYSNDFH